jgi:hypothetical protein
MQVVSFDKGTPPEMRRQGRSGGQKHRCPLTPSMRTCCAAGKYGSRPHLIPELTFPDVPCISFSPWLRSASA